MGEDEKWTRVGVGDNGRRVGESNPAARLSDDMVERLRTEHEDTGLGYRRLANRHQLPPSTVRDILSFRRRSVPAIRWRRVLVRARD